MTIRFQTRFLIAGFTVLLVVGLAVSSSAQKRRRPAHPTICGNPNVTCKSAAVFQPHDLPFRIPESAVIYDSELFYAVILKSVGANENDCDTFVPETERLEAQALFPDQKVFTSRCADVETLFYTGMNPKRRFMAVYGGLTLAEANPTLAKVKSLGKYPGANIRRMRTGFNGT